MSISEKCQLRVDKLKENMDAEKCETKNMRGFVGCLATYNRKVKGMEFGPAMKEAWKSVKEACAEHKGK